jgi:hypothetical protein
MATVRGTTQRGTTQAFDGANLGGLIDKLLNIQELMPLLKLFFTLFQHLFPPPPAVIPPAPGPIDPGRPGGPQLPQQPIDTRPTKVLTGAALGCTSVERPRTLGSGSYPDHIGMIERKDNFNTGCITFWSGQGRDEDDDEFLGPDLIDADLEFRTTYNIYKNGRLVAVMEGAGDDSPNAEGKPAHWHQSESEGVGFGSSRWLNSAGCDNRIVFREEGSYQVEFVMNGIVSNRVEINVS